MNRIDIERLKSIAVNIIRITVVAVLGGSVVLLLLFGVFVFAMHAFSNSLGNTRLEAIYILAKSAGVMAAFILVILSVKKTGKMAFTDPNTFGYKQKTDKELYTFVAWSCVMAFLFTVITFQIFIYLALFCWFYFIFSMLMFSRVWKFHGKSRLVLFAVLIATAIVSFIAAPAVRYLIGEALKFFNVY